MLYKQAGLVAMLLRLFSFLIILAGCMAGCSAKKPGGLGDYLLPWADRRGVFHLREVRISTLASSSEVSGPAAQVYVSPNFSVEGISGPMARPRITLSNGTKIPMDVQSSLALSTYANFERIYYFERRLLNSSQLRWPRQVAIELDLIDADSGRVELHNARYFGDQDVIGVFPDSGGQLPMAVNSAILSHEHFHAHFQKSVVAAAVQRRNQKDLSQMNFAEPLDYNMMVLRAWNEGLADFYAAVYTGAPDMLNASIGHLKGDNARNADGDFRGFMSAENFKIQLARGQRGNFESLENWCQSVICAYRQGTQLARWLYQYSGRERMSQEMVLSKVIGNLPALGLTVKAGLSSRFMELNEAAAVLVEGLPLSIERCQLLSQIMTTTAVNERFSACGTF